MTRTPLTWTAADAAWWKDHGVCMVCTQPMQLGDQYWCDAGSMIAEPPRVFHAACQQQPGQKESTTS